MALIDIFTTKVCKNSINCNFILHSEYHCIDSLISQETADTSEYPSVWLQNIANHPKHLSSVHDTLTLR